MKEKLVLFGVGDVARIAHFYFTHDSQYEVVAFTVDREYIIDSTMLGLPVIPFDEVQFKYPPDTHVMFVAIGYMQINQIRARKYEEAKQKGYRLVSYLSSKATYWSEQIGDNCFILEDNTIQPFVTIGNNVTLWSGNHIGHDVVIKDHCFIASHVVISGFVVIEPYCFIGVNATLRDAITIAKSCVIGAGTLILHNTEERGVYTTAVAQKHALTSDQLKRI